MREGSETVLEGHACRVDEASGNRHDSFDQRPDRDAERRDNRPAEEDGDEKLGKPLARVAEVEVMDAQAAEQEREDQDEPLRFRGGGERGALRDSESALGADGGAWWYRLTAMAAERGVQRGGGGGTEHWRAALRTDGCARRHVRPAVGAVTDASVLPEAAFYAESRRLVNFRAAILAIHFLILPRGLSYRGIVPLHCMVLNSNDGHEVYKDRYPRRYARQADEHAVGSALRGFLRGRSF